MENEALFLISLFLPIVPSWSLMMVPTQWEFFGSVPQWWCTLGIVPHCEPLGMVPQCTSPSDTPGMSGLLTSHIWVYSPPVEAVLTLVGEYCLFLSRVAKRCCSTFNSCPLVAVPYNRLSSFRCLSICSWVRFLKNKFINYHWTYCHYYF